jgi:hypothetical protein
MGKSDRRRELLQQLHRGWNVLQLRARQTVSDVTGFPLFLFAAGTRQMTPDDPDLFVQFRQAGPELRGLDQRPHRLMALAVAEGAKFLQPQRRRVVFDPRSRVRGCKQLQQPAGFLGGHSPSSG